MVYDLFCCPRMTNMVKRSVTAEIRIRQKAGAKKGDKLMHTKAHASLELLYLGVLNL